jgi:hypothetical protein
MHIPIPGVPEKYSMSFAVFITGSYGVASEDENVSSSPIKG